LRPARSCPADVSGINLNIRTRDTIMLKVLAPVFQARSVKRGLDY